MKSFLQALLLSLFLSDARLHAADQKGAETRKLPVSVEIVVPAASKPDGEPVGNVQVTYADGTKDRWTTKGDCSLARVASDGTVGWTVNGPETQMNASYKLRPNGTLILCRRGKVISKIRSALGFIEEWKFSDDGRQLVLVTRASHGPADIELHDVASGKLLDSVKAYSDNLPIWARRYKE